MTAEEFNARYPVGTPVVAFPGIRPEGKFAGWSCTRLETTTRSVAWELGHGEPVVLVDGYGGGIALTHVDPVEREVAAEAVFPSRGGHKNPCAYAAGMSSNCTCDAPQAGDR